MDSSNPPPQVAGSRESGSRCPHCEAEISPGQMIVQCSACGAVQHQMCWLEGHGCGSYECAPARRPMGAGRGPRMTISNRDLEDAVPLPTRPAVAFSVGGGMAVPFPPASPARTGTNGLAITAFVLALAGIPLFGLITGLIAVVLGAVALGQIHGSSQRGVSLALIGVLLGLADVVGWLILLTVFFPGLTGHGTIVDFEPDLAAMENLAPHIRRAMKANVMITTDQGWRGRGMGSGVIVRIADGAALIVTNRHVIDPSFAAEGSGQSDAAPDVADMEIKLVGQPAQVGHAVWVAPDGIDLAVVSVAVQADEPSAVQWDMDRPLQVGEDVFAIGNPHGLGWTHTQGAISQFRIQGHGLRRIRVIQTSTAINQGNSGGGSSSRSDDSAIAKLRPS
ncbi:MAG: trypsin-like peptidase domain-containing protein, partial [Planctomycetes bacterium]|nr:trypsin-like peptidase domain-containing protein [Planctomycetota bacterium]